MAHLLLDGYKPGPYRGGVSWGTVGADLKLLQLLLLQIALPAPEIEGSCLAIYLKKMSPIIIYLVLLVHSIHCSSLSIC